MNKKSKLEKRAQVINYIYYYELMDKKINADDAFESGDFSNEQIKEIEMISKRYDKFLNLINKHLKSDWDWSRINPYVRSVLIYGSFDFLFNDKNLVINELVLLTKAYAPDDSYKLVNGVLDKMGDYYEQIKKSKKSV